MLGIQAAVPCDNQPVVASPFHDTRFLTEWIQPSNIDIQNKYAELTEGLASTKEKVVACLQYVTDVPYTRFVKVTSNVGGRVFVQPDAWLLPSEALYVPRLNCSNRAFLLTSLLRQELPQGAVWACLGNVNLHRVDGHAWVVGRIDGREYVLETTNPKLRRTLIPIESADIYEDVVYVDNFEIRAIPEKVVREPFSACWCIPWLESYLNKKECLNL